MARPKLPITEEEMAERKEKQRKTEMIISHMFDEKGCFIPVTILEAEECAILQTIKTSINFPIHVD